MIKSSIKRFLLVLPLVLSVHLQNVQAQVLPKDLDAYVARLLKEFEVPGIALAIVKDGKVYKNSIK